MFTVDLCWQREFLWDQYFLSRVCKLCSRPCSLSYPMRYQTEVLRTPEITLRAKLTSLLIIFSQHPRWYSVQKNIHLVISLFLFPHKAVFNVVVSLVICYHFVFTHEWSSCHLVFGLKTPYRCELLFASELDDRQLAGNIFLFSYYIIFNFILINFAVLMSWLYRETWGEYCFQQKYTFGLTETIAEFMLIYQISILISPNHNIYYSDIFKSKHPFFIL